MKHHSSKAFSLIELSIALVIIGLIVGGVLVGKDLIRAAQLRQIVTDSDKFITAYYAFKNKYNCLPGDCANATQFFSSTYNGNGDNIIRFNYEGANVWNHFASAGLIAGNYAALNNIGNITNSFYPKGPFDNSYYSIRDTRMWTGNNNYSELAWSSAGMPYASRGGDQTFITLGSYYSVVGPIYSWGLLSAAQNKSVDVKIDDGMPNTGKVGAADMVSFAGANCISVVIDLNSDYNVTDPLQDACTLVRRFQ